MGHLLITLNFLLFVAYCRSGIWGAQGGNIQFGSITIHGVNWIVMTLIYIAFYPQIAWKLYVILFSNYFWSMYVIVSFVNCDASLTSWRQPFCKWLPPWRKGRITCLWIKSVFDCLKIGIIHETMVVHMTWVWTFFNNSSNHPRMCVLSTLSGNVDKHSPLYRYIYLYIYIYSYVCHSQYLRNKFATENWN